MEFNFHFGRVGYDAKRMGYIWLRTFFIQSKFMRKFPKVRLGCPFREIIVWELLYFMCRVWPRYTVINELKELHKEWMYTI